MLFSRLSKINWKNLAVEVNWKKVAIEYRDLAEGFSESCDIKQDQIDELLDMVSKLIVLVEKQSEKINHDEVLIQTLVAKNN